MLIFLRDLSRQNESDYKLSDARLAETLKGRATSGGALIEVWNKADTAAAVPTFPTPGATDHAVLHLSAKTGYGLQALRQALLDAAGWQAGVEGVFIARERHIQALAKVSTHLRAAGNWLDNDRPSLDLLAEELRVAQHALGEITGEFTSDDLLGVIFSSFCIGK